MAGAAHEVNLLLENILRQPEALRRVAAYQLDPGRPALARCAELLRAGKRIVFSGMGASLNACIPVSYALARRGEAVSVIESSELLYFLGDTLDSDTAVVLVSRSGESVEITKLLPKLKERGCHVIGIVNVSGSTLHREATETIVVNSPSDELVAVQTYTSTLAALALLEAEYFGETKQASSELDETIAMAETLLANGATDFAWPELTEIGSSLYLLGRGATLASVNAGVLLMHEVAKIPAVGMSTAQFRHGPVEVVDENFRAIVFGSEEATAELDLTLAEDLVRIGGSVRWVGPVAREAKITPLWRQNRAAPKRFVQILEAVPLQILAFTLAQARGVPTGQFRFAPAVTLSETGFLV